MNPEWKVARRCSTLKLLSAMSVLGLVFSHARPVVADLILPGFEAGVTWHHVATASPPISLSVGPKHLVFADAGGVVDGLGVERYGALTFPGLPEDVVQVVATSFFSAALTASGDLVVWGNGVARREVTGFGYRELAAGTTHVLALRADGKVDEIRVSGTLGRSTVIAEEVRLLSSSGYHNLILREDGRLIAWGTDSQPVPFPARISGPVKAVAAGHRHGLALMEDGGVVAWGDNSSGQLDVPSDMVDVVRVFAGAEHSGAITDDGTVFLWGGNDRGQTVVPAGLNSASALALGPYSTAFATDDVVFLRSPNSFEFQPGGGAVFDFELGAGIPDSIQWYHDDQPIPGATETVHVIDGQTTGDIGGYEARVMVDGDEIRSHRGWLLPKPRIVSTTPEQHLAAGEELLLEVAVEEETAAIYQWFFNGSRIPGATERVLRIPNADSEQHGEYSVQVRNPIGLATSDAIPVAIDGLPHVSLFTDVEMPDPGEPVTLSADIRSSTPFTFNWIVDGDHRSWLTDTNLSIGAISISTAGSYQVEASNEFGTTITAPFRIAFRSPPAVQFEPSSQLRVIPGELTTIGPVVYGVGPFDYQWRDEEGNPVEGETGSMLQVTLPPGVPEQTHSIVVSNEFGSGSAWLRLRPVDTTEMFFRWGEVEDYVANLGGYAYFLQRVGGSVVSYQWYHEDEPVEGATGDRLDITNADEADVGTYYMVATDVLGRTLKTKEVTLTLVEEAPRFTAGGGARRVRAGEEIRLDFELTSQPAATLEWSKDDVVLSAASELELTISETTAADQGVYTLNASNELGSAESAYELVVLPARQPGGMIAWGETDRISELIGDGYGLEVLDAAVSDSDAAIILADGTHLTTVPPPIYDTAPVPIALMGMPEVIREFYSTGPPVGQPIINGLQPTPGYNWRAVFAEDFRGDFAILSDMYGVIVTGTDPQFFRHLLPSSISFPKAFALTESKATALNRDGSVVIWGDGNDVVDPGPYRSIAAGPKHIFALTVAGTVEVLFDESGVNIPSTPLAGIRQIVAGGRNGSLGFSAALSEEGELFVWGAPEELGIDWPGAVPLVSELWASESAIFALVSDGFQVPIDAHPASATAMTGETVVLSVEHPVATVTYQWEKNGQAVAGATLRELVIPDARLSDAGEYRVHLTLGTGVTTSDPAQVTIHAGPAVTAVSPAFQRVYDNMNVRLSATAQGIGPFEFQWRFNGSPIPGATHSELVISGASEADSGEYELVVNNPHGATPGETAVLEVRPKPRVGRVVEWNDTGYFNRPPVDDAIEVVAGREFRAALREEGTIVIWGEADQLPLIPSTTAPFVHITAGPYHLLALDADGNVHFAATDYLVPEPPPFPLTGAIDIEADSSYSAVYFRDQRFFLWGPGSQNVLYPDLQGPILEFELNHRTLAALLPDDEALFWSVMRGSRRENLDAGTTDIVATTESFVTLNVDGSLTYHPGPVAEDFQLPSDLPMTEKLIDLTSPFRGIVLDTSGTLYSWGLEAEYISPLLGRVVDADHSPLHINVGVEWLGTRIVEQPTDQVVSPGEQLVLEAVLEQEVDSDLQWFQNGVPLEGANSAVLNIPAATFADGGFYFLRVTAEPGTFDSRRVSVHVSGLPVVLSKPDDLLVQEGAPFLLEYEVNARPPYSVRWFRDGVAMPFETSLQLEDDAASPDDGGRYHIAVSNSFGTTVSEAVELTVAHPPRFLSQPLDRWVVPDETVALLLEVQTSGSFEVVWSRDDAELERTSTARFELGPATGAIEGGYQATVVDEFGQVSSRVFQVRLYDGEPKIIEEPGDQPVLQGGTARFEVSAVGLPTLEYQWFKDGEMLAGETGAQLVVEPFEFTDQGVYQVQVSNELDQTVSREARARLTVQRLRAAASVSDHPVLNVPASVVDPVAIDNGASHAVALLADGSVVAWGGNDQGQIESPQSLTSVTSIASGDHHTLALLADGTVIAWGSDEQGQTTVPLELPPVRLIGAGRDNSLALTAAGQAWVWGDGNPVEVTQLEDHQSIIKLVSLNGDHLGLRENSSLLHHWGNQFNPGLSRSQGLPMVDLEAGGGSFYSLVSRASYLEVMRFIPSRNQGATPFYSSVPPVPDSLSVYASSFVFTDGASKLFHSNGAASLPSATLNGWPAANETALGPDFLLTLDNRPIIVAESESQQLPEGGSGVLSVVVDSPTPASYQWLKNSIPIAGATGSELELTAVALEDEGVYVVEVTNQAGSVRGTPVGLTVIGERPRMRGQLADQSAFPGDRVLLEIKAESLFPISYAWFFNGVEMTGETGPALVIDGFDSNDVGLYEVRAFNEAGSALSNRALITRAVSPEIQHETEGAFVGDWTMEFDPNHYGGSKWVIPVGEGEAFIEFTRSVELPGRYQLEMAGGGTEGTITPWIEVEHSSGVTVLASRVHYAGLGHWIPLATFRFESEGPWKTRVLDHPLLGVEDGMVVADALRWTYVPSPPVITQQPAHLFVDAGVHAEFGVVADGVGPFAFQWLFRPSLFGNETPVGDNSPVLSLDPTDTDMQGEYRVLVTNRDGATYSLSASLVIRPQRVLIEMTDNQLLLNGREGWRLQAAPEVKGPYETLDAAGPDYLLPIDNPRRFFRLIQTPEDN